MTGSALRRDITKEVASIAPLDARETRCIQDTLDWIASGAEIHRLEKPAIPPQHLVSYFVVVDGDYVLLVDHKDARLWLPTGGHVDPGEHPRDTVIREAEEELGLAAEFLAPGPVMVTHARTVGVSAGHVDVCLWYVLAGDRTARLDYSRDEFNTVRWFRYRDAPRTRVEPDLARFIRKFFRCEAAGA